VEVDDMAVEVADAATMWEQMEIAVKKLVEVPDAYL
jgi:hypothetical protein